MEKIKQLILSNFKSQNCDVGHALNPQMIHTIKLQLNPKEADLLNDSISQLEADGFISIEKRQVGKCLILKQLGFDEIYPITESEAVSTAKNSIMEKFKSQKSRVGHVIMPQALQNLTQTFNPKIRRSIIKAIEELKAEGYITVEMKPAGKCVVLSQKGYDSIY